MQNYKLGRERQRRMEKKHFEALALFLFFILAHTREKSQRLERTDTASCLTHITEKQRENDGKREKADCLILILETYAAV